MPKQVVPLTNTKVAKAKPKPKEYSLGDGGGLALKILPHGTKEWVLNYSEPFTKKRNRISVGIYPAVSLANARIERDKYRELLAKDISPKVAKVQSNSDQAEAHANTLEKIAGKWFLIKSPDITERYARDIWSSLSSHVFPSLGYCPIHKVKPIDLIGALEPLQEQGNLELVRRICQRLNMIMDYAVYTGVLDVNPIVRISRAFKTPKKTPLPSIAPDQLPRLVQAIDSASLTATIRSLAFWQLHTMTRPSESAGAKWDEIDLEKKVWLIPADRMKRRREHAVPLTPETLAILSFMRPMSGHRDYIFPSVRKPRGHANSSSVNMAIKRMGFKGELVSHGLRTLASTTLNENGFDAELVEVALSHMDKNATRAAYNRTDYLERRREVMAAWSETITKASAAD